VAIHRSEFVRLLRSEFPAVEPYLRDSRINLTDEMSAFLEFAETAIAARDQVLVRRVFLFADRVLAQGNAEVRNALCVSFLEHLPSSSEAEREAISLLPVSLRSAREEALSALHREGAP
jgi:hypothetical protein